jgi:hypothetical protein
MLRLPMTIPSPYLAWVWFLGGGLAETRKATSNEVASFLGSSHSLAGVRSTTVFKCVAMPSVKWFRVLLGGDLRLKPTPN